MRSFTLIPACMKKWRHPVLVIGLLFFIGVAGAFPVRSLLSSQAKSRGGLFSDNKKGGDGGLGVEQQDYSSKASALFGNVRVPAALFAGASGGAAFALPILPTDGVVVGFSKRLYALLMLGALSSQLLAIVVSTTSMSRMALDAHTPTTSLHSFIREEYDFEWVSILTNFFAGMISFVLASGIRAWVVLSCPVTARAALGIIVSSTLLAVSFLKESFLRRDESLFSLPAEYTRYLLQKALHSPLFAVSVILLTATYAYIAIKIPHLYVSLSSPLPKGD